MSNVLRGWWLLLGLSLAMAVSAQTTEKPWSDPATRAAENRPKAIMLINSVSAGPNVSLYTYVHPIWIRWPRPYRGEGLNRILSLVSGINWSYSSQDFLVSESRTERGFLLRSGKPLERSGYFDARKQFLDSARVSILSRPKGGVSRTILPLGFESELDTVTPIEDASRLTGSDLLVGEATDWGDIAAVGKQIKGRILVIEYPPDESKSWSRIWLMGRGWPEKSIPRVEGLPGGLISASNVVPILNDREVEWIPDDSLKWGGANRWFDWHQMIGRTAYLIFALITVLASLITVTAVSKEVRFGWLDSLWRGLLMLPICLLMAGPLMKTFGLMGWAPYHLTSAVVVFLVARFIQFLARKASREIDDRFGIALLGLLCMVWVPADWSLLSPDFRVNPPEFAVEQLGFLAAYGFLAIRWSWRLDGWVWVVPRLVLISVTFFSLFTRFGWNHLPSGAGSIVLLLSWIAAESWLKLEHFGVLFALPWGLKKNLENGFTWSSWGAYRSAAESQAVDLFGLLLSQAVPVGIGTLMLIVFIVTFSGRFFLYQLSKLFKGPSDHLSMILLVGAVTAISLLLPSMLAAAGILLWMWLIVCANNLVRHTHTI